MIHKPKQIKHRNYKVHTDLGNPEYEHFRDKSTTNKEEEKYPIHSKVQIATNMLQKLHAIGVDFAQNQKSMEYADSDFRMLPIRSIAMSVPYTFFFKISVLIYLMIAIFCVKFKYQPFYFFGLFFLLYAIILYWPTSILRMANQYVFGNKTKNFYKRMMTGWYAHEFLMVFVSTVLVGFYFFLNSTYGISITLKILSYPYIKKLGLEAHDVISVFQILSFSIALLVVINFIFAYFAKKHAKRLRGQNIKDIDIENKREEVADKILKGKY